MEPVIIDAGAQIFDPDRDTGKILTEREALARRRTQIVVEVVEQNRIADRRDRTVTNGFAKITTGEQWIAGRDPGDRIGRVEDILIKPDLFAAEAITQRRCPEFGDREARTNLESGGNLRVGRVARVVRGEAERAEITTENVKAEREVAAEQIGLGKAGLDRTREAGDVGGRTQFLAAAAEVALANRKRQDEALDAREARRNLQFASRPFLHIGFKDNLVGRGAGLLFDFQLFLEIAEALQTVAGAAHLDRIEGVAFSQAELAADDRIERDGVAVDLDAFDIDTRRLTDGEGHVHLALVLVAIELRPHIGKGIAEQAGSFGQALDSVLDLLGVIPVARLDQDQRFKLLGLDVTNLAIKLDLAELIAGPLIEHISDDEILFVRRQLGDGRDHAKIGVALGQIKLPQLLRVIRKAIRIIGVVRGKEAPCARLLGRHRIADLLFGELLVAKDVDLADFGLGTFLNFEHHIDAVLFKLNDLGFNRRSETPRTPIQLQYTTDIGTGL